MLASVLPGLREIRAPLVAGFLWLIVLWLLIEFPGRDEVLKDGGAREDLLRLGDVVGRPGLIAAATLAAYLVGSLSEEFRNWVLKPRRFHAWWEQFRTERRGYDTYEPAWMSKRGQQSVSQYLDQELRGLANEARSKGYDDLRVPLELPTDIVADGVHLADWETVVPGVARELYEEVGVIRTRLISQHAEIASEYDRLNSEASLRYAIALPSAAVVLLLAPIELNADCLAGTWAHWADDHGRLDPGDLQEALDAALAVGDFDFANVQHHGTPRERRDALLTGFRGGTPQACDQYLQ